MKTRRNYLLMAMTLVAAFAICSCDSSDDGGSDDGGSTGILEVTPESTEEISYIGGEINVAVKSDGYWSIKADQSWVSFDPLRGNGNGSFKVTVASNSTEESRSAKITVSLEDTNITKDFTVNQGPLEANFEIHRTGSMMADYIGILQFDFLGPQIGLVFEYELIKPGTLTISMPNSHIHTMLSTKKPEQYASTGNGEIDTSVPTVEGDVVFNNLAVDSETGAVADFPAAYPRSQKKIAQIHLEAGTYWACHTMEIDVTEGIPTDEYGNALPGAVSTPTEGATGELFPLTETYDITITFVADED